MWDKRDGEVRYLCVSNVMLLECGLSVVNVNLGFRSKAKDSSTVQVA